MATVLTIIMLIVTIAVGVFAFVLFMKDKFYGYLVMIAGAVLGILSFLGELGINFGEVLLWFGFLSWMGICVGFIIVSQVKVLGRSLSTIHGTIFGGFQEMGAAAKRAADQAKAHEKAKGEGEETK